VSIISVDIPFWLDEGHAGEQFYFDLRESIDFVALKTFTAWNAACEACIVSRPNRSWVIERELAKARRYEHGPVNSVLIPFP
jgi:hypothetical protein